MNSTSDHLPQQHNLIRKRKQPNRISGNDLLRRCTPERLAVPAIDTETPLIEAALAYAEAGWFVLPTSPTEIKNPGSLVGPGWQTKSSRDGTQIERWWRSNPRAGIALHSGRSGAVVFDLDVDSLDVVPEQYRAALRTAQVQHTRSGDRGHYVFAVADGESFGNGAGAFRGFGEVRGKNGVIIAAPTPHPARDGHYRWERGGPVPPLPIALRECLRASDAHGDAEPLTREQLTDFYGAHTTNDRPAAMEGMLTAFENMLSRNGSRHNALVNALPMAFRESVAGCYPAQVAADRLRELFGASFGSDSVAARRSSPAPNEFARTAEWAAAVALLADPAETLARLNRDDPAEAVIDEEAFWTARPDLEHLRLFARSRKVAPWSMFGVVLARVAAVIPPSVVLPPLVGDYGSLNLFVAIAAKSGKGKGTSEAAGSAAIDTEPEVHKATPGSGEGINKEYAFKKGRDQTDLRNSVLFSVAEIDSLAALKTRSASTLMPELRKAWMGEQLGFSYAADEKKIPIREHRYRMTMVVGVQPGRSRTLLEDSDGGTPQRFLWFPTTDPDRPRFRPEDPGRLALPRWPGGVLQTEPEGTSVERVDADAGASRVKFSIGTLDLALKPDPREFQVLDVPQSAVEAIERAQDANLDGDDGNDLDSHANLMQLKVAATMMWLNGRHDKVSEEDWSLAGVVMAVSTKTRAQVVKTLGVQASEQNLHRARAEGERAVAVTNTVAEAAIGRVAENIRKRLRLDNGQPFGTLRKGLARRDRAHLEDAVLRLQSVGDVVVEEFEYNGASGRRLRLKSGR